MPLSNDSPGAAAGGRDLLTLEAAEAALERLRVARPDLWTAQRRDGCRRGIDVYTPHRLPQAFQGACNNFREAHGRLPHLVEPHTTADHWFALKFFHDIPVEPANPADKLEASAFMSAETRHRLGLPERVWVCDRPQLPAAEEVPPGVYWLKISNGSGMQTKVEWPPSEAEHRALQEKVEAWWPKRYGLGWGEWWYALCGRRVYLEADMSPRMAGRAEIKIFVREGVPKLLYAIRLKPDGRNEQTYFDAQLNRIEGRSPPNLPLQGDLPDTIGLMMQAAAEIGRRFTVCRIDFLNLAGGRPGFGEITICHNNARKKLAPAAIDDMARQLLFE